MQEDALNTSAIVLGLWLLARSVVKSRPALPPKTRLTPGTFSYIGTEANPLFEAVDVLGVRPLLLQDFHLIDLLAHFDRERIPERVVHAKGAGAYGEFELTHDVSDITSIDMLNGIGKKTPVLTRFSTVGGEKGSADSARDPRGRFTPSTKAHA